MIIFGVIAHKRTHTIVAADDRGRPVGQTIVGTTSEDHLGLLRWAGQFGLQRRWAVENCRWSSGCWSTTENPLCQRIRLICRLRWHLHELDPGWEPKAQSLDSKQTLTEVRVRLEDRSGVAARLVRDLAERCVELTISIKRLAQDTPASLVGEKAISPSPPVSCRIAVAIAGSETSPAARMLLR
jgi:hypothetical protein